MGLSTSNMMTQANFISATAANGNVNPVWDFTNTWVMYEGNTAPLLRSFMTSLTVSNGVKTYDGQTAGNSAFGLPANNIFGTLSYTGTASGSVNAGSYTVTGQGGLYSNQQGYIISYADGTLTIDPKAVNLTGSRVYDGTADVAANMLSLGGLVGAETLTLSGTGTLANKNVGTGKTVTLGSLTLGDGTGLASNYTFTGGTQTVDITAKALTLTGITAINKTYDATTNATVDASAASYTGLILGDAVSVSATGTFADKNVGAGKTVTLSSSYTGADIGNYSITDQTTTTADIAKADLAVSGLTASNKTYDASTAATLVGTATITALGSDVVTLGGTASGAFVDKNVGTGKAVIVSGHTISGADAGNYNLVQQTGLTADIAKADLAVSGLTASNKTYDASTAATLVGTATITALGSDVVTLGGTASGAFVDKNVGTGKAVTVSGHTISGVDAGNYNLVQQTGLTADIAQKALTLTGVTANNKTYDGSTAATLGGTAAVAALGSDVVSVGGNGSGMFIDKNVGSGKPVIVSGFTLVGADAGNYSVVQPAGVTADITSAPSGGISPTVAQAITVLPGGESLLPAFSAAVNSVTTPAVNPVVVAMNRPNSLLPAAAPNAAAPDAQPDSDPAADNREETSASKAAGVNLQVDGPSIDMAGAVSIMDGGIRLPNDMMVSQRDE